MVEGLHILILNWIIVKYLGERRKYSYNVAKGDVCQCIDFSLERPQNREKNQYIDDQIPHPAYGSLIRGGCL